MGHTCQREKERRGEGVAVVLGQLLGREGEGGEREFSFFFTLAIHFLVKLNKTIKNSKNYKK